MNDQFSHQGGLLTLTRVTYFDLLSVVFTDLFKPENYDQPGGQRETEIASTSLVQA